MKSSSRIPLAASRSALVLAVLGALLGEAVVRAPAAWAAAATLTEVCAAARTGDLKRLKRLLPKLDDLDAAGVDAEEHLPAPVVCAAGAGQLEAVQLLLEKGAKPVPGYWVGERILPHDALVAAAAAGNRKLVEWLLDQKLFAIDHVARTSELRPVHAAAAAGDVEMLKLLLARGAKLDVTDAVGRTPLHHAANAKPEVVAFLLDKGVPVGAQDGPGYTALHRVLGASRLDPIVQEQIVARLLAAKAPLELADKSGRRPLMALLLCESCTKLVKVRDLLIDAGADLNAPAERDGNVTPLHVAVRRDDLALATKLLARKASALAPSAYGPPLLLARSKAMAELLLARGARLDARDDNGRTPLMLAVAAGEELLRFYLQRGVDPKLRDRQGLTALDQARWIGLAAAAKILAPLTPHDPAYPRYPSLSSAKLVPTLLDDLTVEDLVIARNEIYARRGYSFKNPELAAHFAKQGWYKPDPQYDEKSLTELERENVRLLLATEKARKKQR